MKDHNFTLKLKLFESEQWFLLEVEQFFFIDNKEKTIGKLRTN